MGLPTADEQTKHDALQKVYGGAPRDGLFELQIRRRLGRVLVPVRRLRVALIVRHRFNARFIDVRIVRIITTNAFIVPEPRARRQPPRLSLRALDRASLARVLPFPRLTPPRPPP